MQAFEERLTGTWLQDGVEGDITDWLKLEGVGMKDRQIMWLSGYGKGRINLSLVVKDGKVFNLTELDPEFARFRFQFGLDGSRHSILFSEGVPFMAFRNFSVQALMTEAGVIECSMYNDQDELHSKSLRCVSDDGQVLTTDITFFGKDKEIRLKITHKRVETARLSLDDCLSWCPNIFVGDASAEAGKEKRSAVSAPLDGLFAGLPELMECIEHGKRKVEDRDGDTQTLCETSDSEFAVNITKASGAHEVFTHRLDREAGKMVVVFTSGDKEVGSWHLKALAEPLRMECWCTLDDLFVSTVCALTELQNTLDKAIAHKRKR